MSSWDAPPRGGDEEGPQMWARTPQPDGSWQLRAQTPPRRPLWRRLLVPAIVLALLLGGLLVWWLLTRPTLLERAVQACTPQGQVALSGVQVADGGDTLILRTESEQYPNIRNVVCVLKELKTPQSVEQHIETTRALDGQQTDEWEGVQARWTYHPEAGLQMTVERTGS